MITLEVFLNLIIANDIDRIHELINEGTLNQVWLSRALVEAATEGNVEIIQLLIEAGANVNLEFYYGTSLGQATLYGHIGVVEALLTAGADVNYRSIIYDYKTPLILAAQEGYFDIVKILVEAGANINEIRESRVFALWAAAASGYEKIFNYLAPLTKLELRLEAEKILTEGIHQRQIEESASPIINELTFAIFRDDFDKVQAILRNNIDINAYDWCGSTALLVATRKRVSINIIQVLLENGADPNKGALDSREVPLMAAIGSKQKSHFISLLLITAGANVNAQDTYGKTALMIAARFALLEMIQILIQAGSDTNLRDVEGRNALDYAIHYSHEDSFIEKSEYDKVIRCLQNAST